MDLEIVKKEFLNYTNNYDITNFNIKRKIDHSLRVMEISRKIAKSLNINEEEIDLATLIGILHDIGRFEQMRIYNTYNDDISIDHGNLGVEILKKDDYIRSYINEKKYDNIIFTAIRNHNKYKIEENLAEKELLFSKIIRDADKIDILYQATCITWANSIEQVENGRISKESIKPFLEQRTINRKKDLEKIEYPMNHLIIVLGFVFDINFDISYNILKETDYMNKIIDRFNFKDIETRKLIEQISNIINTYIDRKIKGW